MVKSVRASAAGLCGAGRHRFKLRPIHDFLSVPLTLYCMSSLYNLSVSFQRGSKKTGCLGRMDAVFGSMQTNKVEKRG